MSFRYDGRFRKFFDEDSRIYNRGYNDNVDGRPMHTGSYFAMSEHQRNQYDAGDRRASFDRFRERNSNKAY